MLDAFPLVDPKKGGQTRRPCRGNSGPLKPGREGGRPIEHEHDDFPKGIVPPEDVNWSGLPKPTPPAGLLGGQGLRGFAAHS